MHQKIIDLVLHAFNIGDRAVNKTRKHSKHSSFMELNFSRGRQKVDN